MTDRDVIVVEGGPAGCSAAVFTARYGLDTLVLDRGSSSIQQCAFIENYLGFPAGVDVETFYATSQAQAEWSGATVVEELVAELEREDSEFAIETRAGEYTADRVVAASTYDVSYLEPLLGAHFKSENGETWLDPDLAEERGGTPVDGLWVAGPTAGVESQIAVSVGHGARVGIDVVADYRRDEEDCWDAVADYTDWVVEQGRYDADSWLETIAEYHIESAPETLDEGFVEQKAHQLAKEQQAQQIDETEIERRTDQAHRRLLEYVDDELLLERARELEADLAQVED